MNHTYLRGDMYYADLGRGIGSEQEGYRPVVIIQNNVGTKHSPTVIIASITSKTGVKAKLPTHYYIDAEDGLELPSIVLLEQLRTGSIEITLDADLAPGDVAFCTIPELGYKATVRVADVILQSQADTTSRTLRLGTPVWRKL